MWRFSSQTVSAHKLILDKNWMQQTVLRRDGLTKYLVRKFDVGNDAVCRGERRPHAHAIRRRKLSMWQQVQARIWGFGAFAQDRDPGRKKKRSSLPVPLSGFGSFLSVCAVFCMAVAKRLRKCAWKSAGDTYQKYQMNLHRPQWLQPLTQSAPQRPRCETEGERERERRWRNVLFPLFHSVRPVKLVRLH